MCEAASFWKWFVTNNKDFLNLNGDTLSHSEKDKLLDQLQFQLHQYCDKLYFEIGGWPGKEHELVITADGNPDYFGFVEELIADAPVIENWYFTALIQPRELDYICNFEDVELKPLDLWFLPLDNRNKPKSIGLRICLPNYEIQKQSEWVDAAVWQVLTTVLGERAAALDVDYFEISDLPDRPEDHGMMELKDLSAFIKWKKAKLSVS